MAGTLFDLGSLGTDLDTAARRRLWLLGQLIERGDRSDIASALGDAEKLERFILGAGVVPTFGSRDAARRERSGRRDLQTDGVVNAQAGDTGAAAIDALSPASMQACARQDEREAAREGETDGPPRIPPKMLDAETHPPVQKIGPDRPVAPLARLQRRARPRSPAAKRHPHAPQLDRETELRMQEEFLRNRPPPAPTMDDVVRYLRQLGDVVVVEGHDVNSRYLVNYTIRLTPQALVERANEKRHRQGRPAFVIRDSHPERPGFPGRHGDRAWPQASGAMDT